ncbi:GGDEF domain-containing phosphodiesterase [uncultured Amphritea sp.]|uniref:putative bifunctional diguanylate cyclase/phosphodiesterase n=1 Tax=uncultured Amphritea sp. TaxID=981605 RepID=UPI00260642FA|nr:GGDEF domain-containing phosphodiesterase [uncultured Amphritea sp.]
MIKDHQDRIEEALQLSERQRIETQRLSGVGFWELNHKANTLYWSEEIFSIYGIDPHNFEPDYTIFANLIFDDDREMVESAFHASVADGTEYSIRYRVKCDADVKWIEAKGLTYYDESNNPERSIGTAQDISEIIKVQQENEFLAKHDALTGLPNRSLFSDRFEMALNYAERHNNRLAVLFIDLDNFKEINDRHGHEIGDQILKAVANQLASSARKYDTFARMGGDEFVGLLAIEQRIDVEKTVHRVKKSIERSYLTDVGPLEIEASIGVTLFPDDHEEADALLRHADHAMYTAKEEGRSRIRFFDSKIHHTNVSRHELLGKIKQAIADNQFQLYYQPKISLKTGQIEGVETLLRWFPNNKPFPPAKIIEAISGTSLEWQLDIWVFTRLLSELTSLRKTSPHLSVSINFNQSTIENDALPERLAAILAAHGQQAEGLEIEILEVASIREFEKTNHILERCKQLGFTTSLDDFGTGYSSLTYFHALPVDTLKIDQRFIKNLLLDSRSLALTKSILALAKANEREVVAEGVESYAIASKLLDLGCDYAQGFGIARPMSRLDWRSWSNNWDPQRFLSAISPSQTRHSG